MYVNKQKLREEMNKEAEGSYREFARQLDVDPAQLHRLLNTDSQAGPKFFGKLMIYCSKKNLDFNSFIFLDQPLTAVNDNESVAQNIVEGDLYEPSGSPKS